MGGARLKGLLKKMERDWDQRAQENARYYVATAQEHWTDEEFFRSGQAVVQQEILNDMINICQGKDPKQMRVVEIGCGAGRVTRALAEVFGEVHGVDVSSEMVKLARQGLSRQPNAFIHKNNGMDLRMLGDGQFDFVFSCIVFQHIPNPKVIENYVREVHRVLRPGALFKFQVQGCCDVETTAEDTWLGVAISDEEAVAMALRCGFEPRYRHGAGEHYFWLWYFKR